MRKSLVYSFLLCILFNNTASAQVGNLLKSVKKSVTKELLGTPAKKSSNSNSGTSANTASTSGTSGTSNTNTAKSINGNTESTNVEPEPSCACDLALLVMEMGKYQIDYTEISVSVLDDGSTLVKDNKSGNYYIIKGGATEGPFKKGDPKIAQFQTDKTNANNVEEKDIPKVYSSYISKSGEKYIITFNGKNYGPYSVISKFVVSKTKDKFAAIVTVNVIMTTEFREKYEALLNKAKTDDQRMQISMQMSKEMSDKTDKYGPQSDGPIFVSNIQGAKFDNTQVYTASLYNNIKYGEIVTESATVLYDLQGKKLLAFDYSQCSPESMFISSDNSKYACYSEGKLILSDKREFDEVFNPYLLKEAGKGYLAYLYYSPKRNAIMQCKIPF